MNDAKQIIRSGILERFVLGLTDTSENQEVKQMVRKYPEVRTQIIAIREAMSGLTKKYNIPPPPNRQQSNDRRSKTTSWVNRLFLFF